MVKRFYSKVTVRDLHRIEYTCNVTLVRSVKTILMGTKSEAHFSLATIQLVVKFIN